MILKVIKGSKTGKALALLDVHESKVLAKLSKDLQVSSFNVFESHKIKTSGPYEGILLVIQCHQVLCSARSASSIPQLRSFLQFILRKFKMPKMLRHSRE